MKRLTSYLNKLENKHFLAVWLVYHIAIVAFFGFVLLSQKGKISIDADLFNMFPKSFVSDSIKAADEKVTELTGQNVFILVKNEDFSKAKNAAVSVYDSLENSSNFTSVSLYNDMTAVSGVTDYIYKYRWNLLDDETADNIINGGAEEYSQNALAQAYGSFNMLPLDNLDTDPFMLTEAGLNKYLDAVQSSGTAMSVKDGVLASKKDVNWYIMIRGVLSKKGAALASKNNGVSEIYRVCSPLENDGTTFIYSGTPFHSHQSSNSASREISIISTVSLAAVVIILLLVFKSGKPIGFSVLSILISILTAVLITLSIFKKMHILTLVFGTSLIGSCIDYSLHYFIHWAANKEVSTGREIRNKLLPGLIMAIISSVLCFAILLFAPFNLLKQMSVFSVFGLISSFLTTIAIYPYIPLPKEEKRSIVLLDKMKPRPLSHKKIVGRIVITTLIVVSLVIIVVCHKSVKIENNVISLYKMEGRLLDDEIESGKVLQYNPTGWFIIMGSSEEDVLKNEEKLTKELDAINQGRAGYLGTSLFVPSIQAQMKSREASKKLLELADYQLEALGYDSSYADKLRADFKKSENDYISILEGNVPDFLMSSISSAWLGKIENNYYSIVLPSTIVDSAAYKELGEDGNIFFVNKMADMGSDLDKLTILILEFFLIAYVIMFVVLKFFYNLKQTMKIISIPFLIILVTVAVFALTKTNLEFFSITGLILVFGLGLDYVIYMMENENKKEDKNNNLEPFAIMLSFITTVISFGALALSSFKPVHLMGLSIFLGLTTAYISSFFYDRS
jgi:predicted exporter